MKTKYQNETLTNVEKKNDKHFLVTCSNGLEYGIQKVSNVWTVSAECRPKIFQSTKIKDCFNKIESDSKERGY